MGQAFLFLYGLAFFVAIYGMVLYRTAFRWQHLAKHYERPWRSTPAIKHLQTAALYGEGVALNTYSGIVTLGVHPDGLAIKLLEPFGVFHPPLFIPYEEITAHRQNWYLNAKSVELEFRRIPDIKVVMPADQVSWIRRSSGADFDIIDEIPAHGQRPDVSRALMVTVGLLGVVTGVFVLIQQLLSS